MFFYSPKRFPLPHLPLCLVWRWVKWVAPCRPSLRSRPYRSRSQYWVRFIVASRWLNFNKSCHRFRFAIPYGTDRRSPPNDYGSSGGWHVYGLFIVLLPFFGGSMELNQNQNRNAVGYDFDLFQWWKSTYRSFPWFGGKGSWSSGYVTWCALWLGVMTEIIIEISLPETRVEIIIIILRLSNARHVQANRKVLYR